MSTTGERFERAVSIMERLRAPGGCPWDREQTFDSIQPYTVEETYEVLEAIDNRDWHELSGELGDLLLQVLFYAQMAQEQGSFSIDDVLDRLSGKLVHRHPHVFGDVKVQDTSEVLRNWESLKAEEKKQTALTKKNAQEDSMNGSMPESLLAGVSSAMPSLMEAHKLSSRAAKVGFDWPDVAAIFAKLEEETRELQSELSGPGPNPSPGGSENTQRRAIAVPLRERIAGEVGDLLFVVVNLARHLSIDPETALRKTNRKFRNRFQRMEARLRDSGRGPEQASMEELEALWQQAKQEELEAR